jgi:hypothetical protein
VASTSRTKWAVGAAVARFPDTEEVAGSIPVPPTRTRKTPDKTGVFLVEQAIRGSCRRPEVVGTFAYLPFGDFIGREYRAHPVYAVPHVDRAALGLPVRLRGWIDRSTRCTLRPCRIGVATLIFQTHQRLITASRRNLLGSLAAVVFASSFLANPLAAFAGQEPADEMLEVVATVAPEVLEDVTSAAVTLSGTVAVDVESKNVSISVPTDPADGIMLDGLGSISGTSLAPDDSMSIRVGLPFDEEAQGAERHSRLLPTPSLPGTWRFSLVCN